MKRRKARTRRDRRSLRPLGKTDIKPTDPTLMGKIMILVSNLIDPYPGADPTDRLPAVLKATRGRKEFFLKCVVSDLMIIREKGAESRSRQDSGKDSLEYKMAEARKVIADHIARYWGKEISPEQLEHAPQEWENLCDLSLGYDPEKLPKAKKVPRLEKSIDMKTEVDNPPEGATEEEAEEFDLSKLEEMFDSGEFDEYD